MRSSRNARRTRRSLTETRSLAQIAKAYGVHPNSIGLWKKAFVERGPLLFERDDTVAEYERRIEAIAARRANHGLHRGSKAP